jgi:deoxyribodipyrimidine photo-lyase
VDEPPLLHRPHGGGVPERFEADEVWLAHPWALGEPPPGMRVLGVVITDAHHPRPWSETRWHWVQTRLASLSDVLWVGRADEVAAALEGVRRPVTLANPHIDPWLPQRAERMPEARHFKPVSPVCGSFSRWWERVQRRT